LEIEALLSMFSCLESISEYNHVMAIAKLFKLKTAFEDYTSKFVTKNKIYPKILLWQWIKYACNVLEARIALYFNPFFISQQIFLESPDEEIKGVTSLKERKIEPILLEKKFCLFDRIREFCSEFLCHIFIILDKSLLKSQPTLIFNTTTEPLYQFNKTTNLLKIYDYAKDDKLIINEESLTKLSSLINSTKSKVKLDDNKEPIEDEIKDNYKFFIAHIDVAVNLAIIAADIYSKKKYNEKIKKGIRALILELRSYSVINKLKELSS